MIKKLTLKEARAAGLHKYWPVVTCKRGHTSMRYAKTGACIDCVRWHCRERRDFEDVTVEAHVDDIAAIKSFAANLCWLRKIS